VAALDPTIHLDIRYATTSNFTARAVYPQARALLVREAAEALVRAHRRLVPRGHALLVFDAYRPWSVTRLFWELATPRQRRFLASPAKGSRHNRGCAVDVSLFDLAAGREAAMPSAYDEMTARAHPDYAGGTVEERARRDLLRQVLEAEGFTVQRGEWWHFDYRGWDRHPVLDVPFEEIPPSRP
jgi:D-alanyl-D-alanine dipeptidase